MGGGSVEQVDQLLYELSRGLTRGRIVVGAQAARFVEQDGPAQLGFSNTDAYAKEQLSRGGRYVEDATRLARRLEACPRIGAAYDEGRLSASMADLIARHAEGSPDIEGELLALALTEGVTVHAMRDFVRAEVADDDDDAGDERCTVEEVVPTEANLLAEATRMAIEHLSEGNDRDWFEHLVAEGISTCPELFDGSVMPEVGAEIDAAARRGPDGAARRRELEELAEPDLPVNAPERGDLVWLETVADDAGPRELDGAMRRNALRLASRDLYFGQVARDFFRAKRWRALGYATEHQYCKERLGMSRSAVYDRITLARRCERLPRLAEDVSALGGIGYEHAKLLASIATPATEAAWLARANKRTYKDLRDEVRCVRASVRMGHVSGPNLAPPTADEMDEWGELERQVISGTLVEGVMGADPDADSDAEIWIGDGHGHGRGHGHGDGDGHGHGHGHGHGDGHGGNAIQISAQTSELAKRIAAKVRSRARKGESRFCARTHRDIGRLYRAARERWRRLGNDQPFLMVSCVWFWQAWLESLRAEISKYDHIHKRDKMRCASPGCFRRLLTLHHILRRMLGGDDPWTNLLTLCDRCHLTNIHELGSLQVFGEAPGALTFVFGIDPIFAVRGRDKIAAA